MVSNVTQTPGEKTLSLEVSLVKLDKRKCLDIVCEIQIAIFVRQLAMSVIWRQNDETGSLNCGCTVINKKIEMVQKEEGNQACRIYIYPL